MTVSGRQQPVAAAAMIAAILKHELR